MTGSKKIEDNDIDQASEDSFPASDPPSWTSSAGHSDAAKSEATEKSKCPWTNLLQCIKKLFNKK